VTRYESVIWLATVTFVVVAGCRERAATPVPEHRSSASPTLLAAAAPRPALTAAPLPPPPDLRVPHAQKKIVPDGHFDVRAWGNSVNTHTLLDENGDGAVPVSEARFLWSERELYVSFYAADLDLHVESDRHDGPTLHNDGFTLVFYDGSAAKDVISVSVKGVVTDGRCPLAARDVDDPRCDLGWESHARVAADYDGTINQLGDFDEEWNVELAIPFAALVGHPGQPDERLSFSVERCEIAHDGPRECGSWGDAERRASLVLAPPGGRTSRATR